MYRNGSGNPVSSPGALKENSWGGWIPGGKLIFGRLRVVIGTGRADGCSVSPD